MSEETEGRTRPSFSIVIEAFTITAETVETLETCLRSLASQSLSPQSAEEVVLMETGHAPPQEIEAICRHYPWIRIVSMTPGTHYFAAKMAGAERVGGEVVVFCDADNEYLPGWLEAMVRSFEDPAVKVVTGETSVHAVDLYATIFGLTFFFPPFSNDEGLVEHHTYFGNNSAFRRSFLLANPIPAELPLVRGHDYVHSVLLRRQGHTIYRQPSARAFHEPPGSLHEFVLRYLARGSDRLEHWRLTRDAAGTHVRRRGLPGSAAGLLRIAGANVRELITMTVNVPRQTPRALLYYPVALPLATLLLGVTLVGIIYSALRPGVLVDLYFRHYAAANNTAAA